MLKKHFFLLLVFFSCVMNASQDAFVENQTSGWSTKKKVVVGVAAVAVVGVAGVTIYYGPAAVIAFIKATAVAAKVKVVTVVAKAAGATHVVTLGEGAESTTFVMFGNGAKVKIVVGGAGFVAKSLKDALLNQAQNLPTGSTIKVIKAFNSDQYPVVVAGEGVTGEDLRKAFNFTKDSLELVVEGIQEGLRADQKDFKEAVEEEWVPNALIADKIKQVHAKDPFKNSFEAF